ncbi:unnamed protein product [marine sediment metagenome]|uniref:Uncharacterized protein n=1 Tax=marine sediment metagenome TaxID=412755 RepID=X1T640_9ZZZZ
MLLEENPLEDISNTRGIAGVMIKGQYFSEEDIQNELDNISQHYTSIK